MHFLRTEDATEKRAETDPMAVEHEAVLENFDGNDVVVPRIQLANAIERRLT